MSWGRKWVLGGTQCVSSGFTAECPRNVQCTKLQDSQHAIFALIINNLPRDDFEEKTIVSFFTGPWIPNMGGFTPSPAHIH